MQAMTKTSLVSRGRPAGALIDVVVPLVAPSDSISGGRGAPNSANGVGITPEQPMLMGLQPETAEQREAAGPRRSLLHRWPKRDKPARELETGANGREEKKLRSHTACSADGNEYAFCLAANVEGPTVQRMHLVNKDRVRTRIVEYRDAVQQPEMLKEMEAGIESFRTMGCVKEVPLASLAAGDNTTGSYSPDKNKRVNC